LAAARRVSPARARAARRETRRALLPPGGPRGAAVPLPAAPAGVAAGSGAVWVTEPGAGLVVRVDQRRRAVTATIPAGTRPSRVVAVGGPVRVPGPAEPAVPPTDPPTNTGAPTMDPAPRR